MKISNVRPSILPNAVTLTVDDKEYTVNKSNIAYYIYNATFFSSELELYYLLNVTNKMFIILDDKADPIFLTDNIKQTFKINQLSLADKHKLAEVEGINSVTLRFYSTNLEMSVPVRIIPKITCRQITVLEVLDIPRMLSLTNSVIDFNRIICDVNNNVLSISSNLEKYLPSGCDYIGLPLSSIAFVDITPEGQKVMQIGEKIYKVTELKINQGASSITVYSLDTYVDDNSLEKSMWLQFNAWMYKTKPVTMAILNITSMKMINNSRGFQYGNKCIDNLKHTILQSIPEAMLTFHNISGNIIVLTNLGAIELQAILEEVKKHITLNYSFVYSIATSKELNECHGTVKNYEDFTHLLNIANTRLTWEKSTNKFISLDILKSIMYTATPETKMHCTRIQTVSLTLADQLSDKYKISPTQKSSIGMGGLLHDIGKIFIPPNILNKPGKLTDEEFRRMRQHAELGGEIFKEINTLKEVYYIVRHHHEKYDGTGYPDKISLKDLPISVSIVSLADSVDAMLSARCYKEPMTIEYCIEELKRCSGKQFHPDVVEAFMTLLKQGKLDGLLNIEMEDNIDEQNVKEIVM